MRLLLFVQIDDLYVTLHVTVLFSDALLLKCIYFDYLHTVSLLSCILTLCLLKVSLFIMPHV